MSITDELREIIPEIDFATNRDRLRDIADLIDMKHEQGRGTCREAKIDRYWRGCGECGYIWEYMYGIGKCESPRYCPNCGRKVVED